MARTNDSTSSAPRRGRRDDRARPRKYTRINSEAVDYKDLHGGSKKVHDATKLAASQAAHLARVLADNPYPAR